MCRATRASLATCSRLDFGAMDQPGLTALPGSLGPAALNSEPGTTLDWLGHCPTPATSRCLLEAGRGPTTTLALGFPGPPAPPRL